MNLDLTPEQDDWRCRAREFAENDILPRATETDQAGHFPRELFNRSAQVGMAGALAPREYGGFAIGEVTWALVIEEIARQCASTARIISVHGSLVIAPIAQYAGESQKRDFLPRLAGGECLGAYALSEPESGLNPERLRTRARKEGGAYRISGVKSWVTNGVSADLFLVFADLEGVGPTAFVVERGRTGVSFGAEIPRLGMAGSGTCDLLLDDCEIPAANRIGREGGGVEIARRTLSGGQIAVAALAVGIARAALEDAIAFVQTKRHDEKPLGEYQAVQFLLADMCTEIEAARSLTQRAAWLKESGADFTLEASVAKLFASETATAATTKGLRIFGGYGYSKLCPMERYFRDSRATEISEGSSEAQRDLIASKILAG